jgi:hypothetical protein
MRRGLTRFFCCTCTRFAEALVSAVSQLKSIVIGGVFRHFFDALLAGRRLAPFQFALRTDTTVFLVPAADRVTVLFALNFTDRVDRAVARVFLHELVEVIQAQQALSCAPTVRFSRNPPDELSPFGITEPIDDAIGIVSFRTSVPAPVPAAALALTDSLAPPLSLCLVLQ